MPLVTNSGKITIPFDGESDELIREAKKVTDELARVKASVKQNGDLLEQQARREQEAIKKTSMSWTDFRSMYQTGMDAIRLGQAVWDETGQKAANYAVEVGNAARLMGVTTEEASRLRQASDDVGIGYASLTTALKMARKDGFETNIEAIAKMSDEFLKLQPGAERSQYLMDRFGKSGEDMEKILVKGSAAIREMSAAIDENLIVTELGYKQAEQYRVALDDISDAAEGLKIQIGQKLIPPATDLIDVMKDNVEEGYTWEKGLKSALLPTVRMGEIIRDLKAAHAENTAELEKATTAAREGSEAFEDEAEMTKRLAEEAKIAEEAIKAITKANQDYLKEIGSLTGELDKYHDKERDLKAEHEELLAKKEQLIRDGWWAESKEIQEVNKDLAENETKQQENATEFELATKRRILARTEEILAQDGLTQSESDALLQQGLNWGIYSQEAVTALQEIRRESDALVAKYSEIPKEINTTISTYHVDYYQTVSANNPRLKHEEKYGMASGGSFIVPQSAGNEGFQLGGVATASAGEKVTVTPRGQSGFDRHEMRALARYIGDEFKHVWQQMEG